MIGVISKDHEREAVREFFQLFKTPWEFCAPHQCLRFTIRIT
jgi:hypothetical protein